MALFPTEAALASDHAKNMLVRVGQDPNVRHLLAFPMYVLPVMSQMTDPKWTWLAAAMQVNLNNRANVRIVAKQINVHRNTRQSPR